MREQERVKEHSDRGSEARDHTRVRQRLADTRRRVEPELPPQPRLVGTLRIDRLLRWR